MERLVLGRIVPVYHKNPKAHAVPEERIKTLSSLGAFRPALCGERVIPETQVLGTRRFLIEFNPQAPDACRRCVELMDRDYTVYSRRLPVVE